jgi:putative PIN family toxin of toxin-antitoxin system
MLKVIVDTNVFVSALIQRNYPYYIVDKIFSKEDLQLCISKELLEEYFDVLNRKKFSKFADFYNNAQILLASIEDIGKSYKTTVKLNILTDKDDNKILELAEISKANYIITGNTTDFTITHYKRTKIVTPKQFWESHFI